MQLHAPFYYYLVGSLGLFLDVTYNFSAVREGPDDDL